MKSLINMLRMSILLLSSVIPFSCSNEFIDLAPISDANVASFYKTQADFETAIIGVYSIWGNEFQTRWTEYNEFRGDTYTYTGISYQEISENMFTTNTTLGFWTELYKIISNSNTILDKIDNVEFDEEVKSQIKAEARFFRAEAYFALVRFFGAVPLTEHETSSTEAMSIGRTDVETIYDLIEDDYMFAVNNLPVIVSTSDYGRITKYAAEGELARVYITLSGKVHNKNRWADAKPLLEDVLFNSPYSFADTYEEIFAKDGSNEKGKEIILSAIFKAGNDRGSQYNYQFCGLYGNILAGTYFEEGVLESYEAGDIRKDVNIQVGFTTIDGIYSDMPTNVKFAYGYDPTYKNSGVDFPILRYTDAYLLYAETLAEIANGVPTQSLEILNEVRNRAGLTSKTAVDIPDLASFRLAMEKERRSELMFECVRWFDLIRTGRAVAALQAIGKNADDTWLLFPIPQYEIDIVGEEILPQNPGY